MNQIEMKKVFLLAIAFVFSLNVTAQITAPDYELIEYEINNKSSKFYYKDLLRRFRMADTTMTLDDVRHLYYGSSFQSNRKPVSLNNKVEIIEMMSDPHVTVDNEKIIEMADKAIAENFLDLDAYYYKFTACLELYGRDLNDAALKTSFQYNSIISAILSSGDGLSAETAMHVVDVSHEYHVLRVFNLGFDSQKLIKENERFYDVMYLNYNSEENKIYFDVTSCPDNYNQYFKEEPQEETDNKWWKKLLRKKK